MASSRTRRPPRAYRLPTPHERRLQRIAAEEESDAIEEAREAHPRRPHILDPWIVALRHG